MSGHSGYELTHSIGEVVVKEVGHEYDQHQCPRSLNRTIIKIHLSMISSSLPRKV